MGSQEGETGRRPRRIEPLILQNSTKFDKILHYFQFVETVSTKRRPAPPRSAAAHTAEYRRTGNIQPPAAYPPAPAPRRSSPCPSRRLPAREPSASPPAPRARPSR